MTHIFPTERQRIRLDILFELEDGTEIRYGDPLYFVGGETTTGYQRPFLCRAEYNESSSYVTVRTRNGAVPTVKVSDLRADMPERQRRCKTCGQLLPKGIYI